MPDDVRFNISLSRNAASIVRSCQTLPSWMLDAVVKSMDRENQLTISRIQQLYLSFPKDGPTVPIGCRVITNRLRGSINASKAVKTGNGVNSTIGSNVVYAAAQEFGVDKEVTVSPHTRKSFREEMVFGKRRVARKADIGVRSFQRHMKLEGRGFVRQGIKDRLPNYSHAFSDAMVISWNKNATQ